MTFWSRAYLSRAVAEQSAAAVSCAPVLGEPRGGKPYGGGDNGELISSSHNLGQLRWVPRKGAVARTIQRRLRFFWFTHLRSIHVTNTSETQGQNEQPESTAPSRRSSRKSVLALSVFALGLNATAAVYTMPSFDIALPNVSSWVGLLLAHQEASAPISDAVSFDVRSSNASSLDEQLSQQQASVPKPDPVVAALRDIQLAQQHVASLQEISSSLPASAGFNFACCTKTERHG